MITGRPRSYFKKFAFIVEINGVAFAGFQKAGPLSGEVAVIEQWEGGTSVAEDSPGRYKTTPLVLERGATKDLDLWTWFSQVVDASTPTAPGLPDVQYKRTFDLVQRDRDGTELRRWTAHKAWPTKFEAGDWDNNADANVIESVTLRFRRFAPKAV